MPLWPSRRPPSRILHLLNIRSRPLIRSSPSWFIRSTTHDTYHLPMLPHHPCNVPFTFLFSHCWSPDTFSNISEYSPRCCIPPTLLRFNFRDHPRPCFWGTL